MHGRDVTAKLPMPCWRFLRESIFRKRWMEPPVFCAPLQRKRLHRRLSRAVDPSDSFLSTSGLPTKFSITLSTWLKPGIPHLETLPITFGLPHTPPCARPIVSKLSLALTASGIIGRLAAGPISAIPPPPPISFSSDPPPLHG